MSPPPQITAKPGPPTAGPPTPLPPTAGLRRVRVITGAAVGAVGACIALAVLGTPWPAQGPTHLLDGRTVADVVDVVDGDTITVEIGHNTETVRLLGIDTPEKLGGPRPAECGGAEATAFTRAVLPSGTNVRLERDADARDQYGRVLAYVFRADDDLFVNRALIESGHATATFYEPNTTWRQAFTRAELTARRAAHGFWGTCGGPSVLLADQ